LPKLDCLKVFYKLNNPKYRRRAIRQNLCGWLALPLFSGRFQLERFKGKVMNALILGGCGFIGSHIVDALLAQNHCVRVFDQRPERFRAACSGADYIFGNFSDRAVLIESLTKVDTVFHLINTTFPSTANINPQADVADNLINTLNLLKIMIDLGIPRIVYLSSGGTVYGVPEVTPISEGHPLRPINSYGIVKTATEHYLEMYRREGKLSPIVIRPANPYGPRQAHTGVQGVVATFMKRALDHQPIEIWGDGTVTRDYFHVTDLARLCVAAAASEAGGAFNAGSGVGTSLNDIIAAISLTTGIEVTRIYKPARSVDVPRSILDISRAKDVFGWEPRIALPVGLKDYCAWIRAQS
jgi:UDP-glucose 4-epimerase